MNNYIYKIAKNNIRKDKKLYTYIFLSIFMTFFIIILANVLLESLEYSIFLQNTTYYGKWDIAYLNPQESDIQLLEQSHNVTNIGKIFYGGEVIENNQYLGYIGYYDDIGLELANLQIMEGRYANNENEIVVEKVIQKEYGYSLNETITLNYTYDNQTYTHKYKLVGVIQNYSSKWLSRGPSFITTQMKYHEMDILVTGKYVNNLWNENGDGIKNTYLYPEYKLTNNTGYTNESNTFQTLFEILIISMVVVITTMMSSLNKRESQFVMLRSVGMTYKQLQRLIIYEGVILASIASIGSILFGLITSVGIMYIYSLIAHVPFAWSVGWITLLIEIGMCILVLTISIILPTLTVYDLPLTRKNGEFTYHPHQKRIRKPTFIKLTKNQFISHLGFYLLTVVLISFMMVKGNSVIENISQYQNKSYQVSQTDFIWSGYDCEAIETLQHNKNIHIYSSITYEIYILETSIDVSNARLVCPYHDDEIKNAIHYNQLKDNEAIILCPKNYQETFSYTMEIMTYFDLENEDNSIYRSFKIANVVYLDDSIERDYLKYRYSMDNQDYVDDIFAIVVNENTYKDIMLEIQENNEDDEKNLLSEFEDNNFSIYTDREIDKIQVHNCFINMIEHTKFYDYAKFQTFVNVDIQNYMDAYGTSILLVNQIIYSTIFFIALICVFYLMKFLFTLKIKKELGILNVLGMTKTRIYIMQCLQSLLTFICSLILAFIYWYVFSCEALSQVFLSHLKFYVLSSLIVYIIYIIATILSLHFILKQKSLNLIYERIQ